MNNKKNPVILLRSSWQNVNIGDIAHSPAALALLEKEFPEAEIILWAPDDLSDEIIAMEKKRFKNLEIVKGGYTEEGLPSNESLARATSKCDFLLHNSGPFLVAKPDVEKFVKHTGKPFGVFGITYVGNSSEHVYGDMGEESIYSEAKFIFFRETVSLEKAKKSGITSPIMEFGPDVAFSTDVRDDEKAEKFLADNGLKANEFVCCIPKYRITPFWKTKNVPFNQKSHDINESLKEHDHLPLREAIISIIKQTGLKVLICPEDRTEIELGKEILYDKLPDDIKKNVVLKKDFWLPDEALSVYVRSKGLFGNEMHSPIMCVGNGIPAIVCRWQQQTSKGFMWRDIGLSGWLFDMDNEEDVKKVAPTVVDMIMNEHSSREKTERARQYVIKKQKFMVQTLKEQI